MKQNKSSLGGIVGVETLSDDAARNVNGGYHPVPPRPAPPQTHIPASLESPGIFRFGGPHITFR